MIDLELNRARQRVVIQKQALADSEATYATAVKLGLLATQRTVGSKLTRQREAVKYTEAMIAELESAIVNDKQTDAFPKGKGK